MLSGLYGPATGMLALEARQDIIANNIANAATAGFRRQAPVQQGFHATFSARLRPGAHFAGVQGPGGGAVAVESVMDQRPGPIQSTGNPLNLALIGPGYFVVRTPEGEAYTRAGAFAINAAGRLSTHDGHEVLNTAGDPMDVRGGPIEIDGRGNVRAGGIPAGQLQLIEFENPQALRAAGGNLLRADGDAPLQTADAQNTSVQQGYLEASNVNIPGEFTEMLLGLRAYEANQRVLIAADATLSRLIDQVATPA